MSEHPGQPSGGQPARKRTINERAYALWHEAGQPEGKAREYWLRVEPKDNDHSGSASAPGNLTGTEQKQRNA